MIVLLAAVVIPIYKENLNEFEKISLQQVQKILGRYEIIFFAPEGKNFSYTQNYKVVHFPQQFFQGVSGYNTLMLSPHFYEKFLDYDYILIYQLDAFVFSDKLEYFCSLGYDYIGAAWEYLHALKSGVKNFRVGNGGFSLRKVESCYELLLKFKDHSEHWQGNEDVFFAYCGYLKECNFNVAPLECANKFSAEFFIERVIRNNHGELPFGCHGWYRYSRDFYIKIFNQLGYDLKHLANYLHINDLVGLKNSLISLASWRLNRRLNHGQSILRYLPKQNFASVRVIRSDYANFILARLLLENNDLSDKIYFYDESDTDILIHDIKPEKNPHFIITGGGAIDNFIIDTLKQKNISYGNRFLSFWQEYFSSCEKLFHNLGK